MNTASAPLSEAVRMAIAWDYLIAIRVRWIGGGIIIILTSLLVLGYITSTPDPSYLLNGVIVALLALVYIGLVVFTTIRYRKNKAEYLQYNLDDFNLSQIIADSIGTLPKDLASVTELERNYFGMEKLTGLIPLRIEFEPQSSLEGTLKFYFPGLRTAFFGGMVYGKISGEISPVLSEQNVFILCRQENGIVVKLLCPVPKIGRILLSQSISKIMEEWLGQDRDTIPYLRNTHTLGLARSLIGRDIKEIFDQINPNPVIDSIAAGMELPVEQRPKISASGISGKGGFSVSIISCDGEEAIVSPLGLIRKILGSFEAQYIEDDAVPGRLLE